MIHINDNLRRAYLVDIVSYINTPDSVCAIHMFSGAVPDFSLLEVSNYTSFAHLSLLGQNAVAMLSVTNDGIDVKYEQEDDQLATAGGSASWFYFASGDLLIAGTCGTPDDVADMTMLNTTFYTGRLVDFQDIKIRMFSKRFGV